MNIQKEMMTLTHHWDMFKLTIPAEAGKEQRMVTQHSFYAGALSVIKVIDNLVELPEDDAQQVLRELHEEARNYARSVSEGTVQELQTSPEAREYLKKRLTAAMKRFGLIDE